MKLSVVIPCYNERENILKILEKINAVDLGKTEKEIIIVDDFSTDGTVEILRGLPSGHYKIFFHTRNQGKGMALRTGFNHVTGDIVLIQDADLEYDPEDYPKLIEPLLSGEAKVVYGSRERNRHNKKHSGFSFYLGGKFLTWLTNLLYGSRLTDEPTCYKIFDAALLKSIPLTCRRFEFCPEVTAKILLRGIPIMELPISYYPRNSKEGKKIRFRDGVEAIWTLLKYRIDKSTSETTPRTQK